MVHTHFRPYYTNIQLAHSSIETHLSFEGINDELKSMRLDTLNALLHHMIAILIFHTLQHVSVKLPNHLILQKTQTN